MSKEFMSLDWFKERVEKSVDRILDERVANKVDKLLDKLIEPEPVVKGEKLYHTMKLVNDNLTVVLKSGEIFSKPNATMNDYSRIQQAKTRDDILNVIYDKEVAAEKKVQMEEAERITHLVDGFKLLSSLKDFTVDGTTLYLKGTSRSIPSLLVDKFTEVVGRYSSEPDIEDKLSKDDEYQGLKNFFMWCCLNPRAEVADKLYNFLAKNGMKITKQGFFVALRNVVEVDSAGDNLIVQYISNAYNKVKAVWHRNPKDYRVVQCKNNEYCLEHTDAKSTDGVYVGELEALYLDLPNMKENRFTDNWTRTFDIRIGQVVSMAKEACNWSTQDCATAGLHFAGHTAPYVLCGDTTVFTLHNPMKVVGIGVEKGRCWEYLPFMTTNIKEADQIMNSRDFDFLQLDEEYAIKELDGLAEKVKDGFTKETSKYNFNLPSISSAEINSIVLSLNEMKATITKRVSIIK